MSVAIYERVSSGKQKIDSQHPDLQRWADAQTEAVSWFSDTATGRTMERKGFDALMKLVRARKIRTLVVWRIDRLGRTAKGLTALFEELQTLNCNFISLREGIDLNTPAGRLIANVLASVGQYETEVRGERIAAGLAAKKLRVARGEETWANGRPVGSGHKATPEVCRAVRAEAARGTSKVAIARMFKLSRQTVYVILNSAE
jgi:DNA invertase Pin-like site-specific DNA recombinase